jgi:hypothetical protein
VDTRFQILAGRCAHRQRLRRSQFDLFLPADGRISVAAAYDPRIILDNGGFPEVARLVQLAPISIEDPLNEQRHP